MAHLADNWISTAERLRDIRRARDSFLLRWAADVIESGARPGDELSHHAARDIVETLPIMDRKPRLFGSGRLDD